MTDTLTAEQIGELEALLARATPAPWDRDTENGRRGDTFEMLIDSNGKVIADTANSDLQVIDYTSDWEGTRYFDKTGYRNFSAIAALRNAAPALIAMAKQVITHDSPAWDANKRLNATVEDLIERAEKAEAEVRKLTDEVEALKEGRVSKFYAMQMVDDGAPEVYQKFRIMETYQTADGTRSRITDNSFSTLEQAKEWAEEKSKK